MENYQDQKEIWKPVNIDGFENLYLASSFGRVKSVDRLVKYKNGNIHLHKGKELSQCLFDWRYPGVILKKQGNKLSILTHRIIAFTFIPNPDNKPHINHIDGNKQNNNVLNLEWCTAKENIRHSFKTGLQKVPNGELSHAAKMTDDLIREIRILYNTGKYKQADLCRKFNIGASQMCNIVNKTRYWTHVV